jgi:hypothetical protein
MLPFFALAAQGRKVYPRNVNSVQGNSHCPKVFGLMAPGVRILTAGNGMAAG